MSFYQYRKSYCGDKTVVRSSYLHNGISYTGKMSSLYWIGTLALIWHQAICKHYDNIGPSPRSGVLSLIPHDLQLRKKTILPQALKLWFFNFGRAQVINCTFVNEILRNFAFQFTQSPNIIYMETIISPAISAPGEWYHISAYGMYFGLLALITGVWMSFWLSHTGLVSCILWYRNITMTS